MEYISKKVAAYGQFVLVYLKRTIILNREYSVSFPSKIAK